MKKARQANTLLPQVADYYSAKLEKHGQTPLGVDWNGLESQSVRFNQLIRVIDQDEQFSINDVGCGYGALLETLVNKHDQFTYYGNDISQKMVAAAQQSCKGHSNATFTVSDKPLTESDYSVASGIFNVRFNNSDDEWIKYLHETLGLLNETSTRGFSFNCLTSYSDSEKMRDDLFYANPCTLFDYCKRNFSKQVALLHDYGLYEFTIIVRKKH
jgi:SAM-dependent methyltransferase